MSQSLLGQALDLRTAYEVGMNEVKFLRFGQNGLTSIGTANLNGCSAVMVLSTFGVILGHIAPLPDGHAGDLTAGDRHAQSMMDLLTSLYRSHQRDFPTGSDGWVVCAMFEGEVALPDQQRIFEHTLTNLHLPCSLRTYNVAATRARSGISAGKGTIFIQSSGNIPRVYVEDVEVMVQDSYGSFSGSAYTSEVASSSATHTSSTSSSDDPYYFVYDKIYYYRANGIITRLPEAPKNVWVLNDNGWAATDRSKRWRYWDGKDASYG